MAPNESTAPRGDDPLAELRRDLTSLAAVVREIPDSIAASIKLSLLRRKIKLRSVALRVAAGTALAGLVVLAATASTVALLYGLAGLAAHTLDAPLWAGCLVVGVASLSLMVVAAVLAWTSYARHAREALKQRLALDGSAGGD